MSAYFEALEAHNEAQGGGENKSLDNSRIESLRAFNKAHGVDV